MKKALGEILSVSQFNSLVKEVLSSLGSFRVQGEITEFNISQRKGLNITLSDGKANLRVGGYAPNVKGLDLIEKGMNVLVEGFADFYVPYGSFSFSIYSIEPVGEGSLAIAYQKLKEKLASEGLFAEEHKKSIPQFITRIALLTGKDSAAYSDFIKILKENKSGIEILYYPVIVQGTASVQSIKSAFEKAKQEDIDLIVLARGGGSLEDLKSFNDEGLARLIFSSLLPVIVGVGHEKDESICDFVADIRASTPSQAAYYIARQNEDFISYIEQKGETIEHFLSETINKYLARLELNSSAIENYWKNVLSNYSLKLETIERILKSYDVSSVLKRGFGIVKKGNRLLTSVNDIKKGDLVTTTLSDGIFDSQVNYIKSYSYPNAKKSKKRSKT